MLSILHAWNMSPVKNWVDDFVFFRFPIINISTTEPNFNYSPEDIYALGNKLGWPWKRSKTWPFAQFFQYLGFTWDLNAKIITLPENKRLHYCDKLLSWLEGRPVDQKQAKSLHRTLNHCSLIIPTGWSYLTRLSSFSASWNFLSSPYI